MSWFPNQQQIPIDYNVKPSMEPAILVSILDKNTRHSLQTDDLTFILPVGIDSDDRAFNLSAVLTFLMLNTTAKIKIVWSETRENLAKNDVFAALRDGNLSSAKELIEFFEQHSSDKFVNKLHVPPNPGRPNSTAVNLLLMSAVPPFVKAKFGSSGSWGDFASSFPPDVVPKDITQTNQFRSYIGELLERVEISFVLRDSGESFNRMKYINMALEDTKTEFVCNHDTDILLSRSSLLSTLYQLRSTDCDFIYPYEHMSSSKSQFRVFRTNEEDKGDVYSCAILGDMFPMLESLPNINWTAAYGQSIFARTSSYKSAGGENENFISWGAEDVERYVRFCKFGYKIHRANVGLVIHLEHHRGPDSSSSNPHFHANESLWNHLQNLSHHELLSVYNGYEYTKKYGFTVSLRGA